MAERSVSEWMEQQGPEAGTMWKTALVLVPHREDDPG